MHNHHHHHHHSSSTNNNAPLLFMSALKTVTTVFAIALGVFFLMTLLVPRGASAQHRSLGPVSFGAGGARGGAGGGAVGCADGEFQSYDSATSSWVCAANPGAGGGAPTTAEYWVRVDDGTLTNDVIVNDIATMDANAFGGAGFDFELSDRWIPRSASLPGTCTVGQEHMDTSQGEGAMLYLCEATNTWVAQSMSAADRALLAAATNGIYYTSEYLAANPSSTTAGLQEAYDAANAADGGIVQFGSGEHVFTGPFKCNEQFITVNGGDPGIIIRGVGISRHSDVTNQPTQAEGTYLTWDNTAADTRWIDKMDDVPVGWAIGDALTWTGGTGTIVGVNSTTNWLEVETDSGVIPDGGATITRTLGGTAVTSADTAKDRELGAMFAIEGCSLLEIRDLAIIGDSDNDDINRAKIGIYVRARDSNSSLTSKGRLENLQIVDFGYEGVTKRYSGGIIFDGDWPNDQDGDGKSHEAGQVDQYTINNIDYQWNNSCTQTWANAAVSMKHVGGLCRGWKTIGHLVAEGTSSFDGVNGVQAGNTAARADGGRPGTIIGGIISHPFAETTPVTLTDAYFENLMGKVGYGSIGACSEDMADISQDPIEWTLCTEDDECSGTCEWADSNNSASGSANWSIAGGLVSMFSYGTHSGGIGDPQLAPAVNPELADYNIGRTLYNTTTLESCTITSIVGGAPVCASPVPSGWTNNPGIQVDRFDIGPRYALNFRLRGNLGITGIVSGGSGASGIGTTNYISANPDRAGRMDYNGPEAFFGPYTTNIVDSTDLYRTPYSNNGVMPASELDLADTYAWTGDHVFTSGSMVIPSRADDDDCTGDLGQIWYDTVDGAFEVCEVNTGLPPTTLDGAGGAGYTTIEDEGTPLTQRNSLNFTGTGVACVDDTDQTTCTISSSSGTTIANDPIWTQIGQIAIGVTSESAVVLNPGAAGLPLVSNGPVGPAPPLYQKLTADGLEVDSVGIAAIDLIDGDTLTAGHCLTYSEGAGGSLELVPCAGAVDLAGTYAWTGDHSFTQPITTTSTVDGQDVGNLPAYYFVSDYNTDASYNDADLEAALADCVSLNPSGGCIIELDAQTFTGVQITLPGQVREIFGQGDQTILRGPTTGTINPIVSRNQQTGGTKFAPYIHDFFIDGNKQNLEVGATIDSGRGIEIDSVTLNELSGVRIENMIIENTVNEGIAIYESPFARVVNNRISYIGCHDGDNADGGAIANWQPDGISADLMKCGAWGAAQVDEDNQPGRKTVGTGIEIGSYSDYAYVSGNIIQYTTKGGFQTFAITGTPASWPVGVIVENNTVRQTGAFGILLQHSASSTVAGNTVRDIDAPWHFGNTGFGLSCTYGGRSAKLIDNVIERTGAAGINAGCSCDVGATGLCDVTVANNTVIDSCLTTTSGGAVLAEPFGYVATPVDQITISGNKIVNSACTNDVSTVGYTVARVEDNGAGSNYTWTGTHDFTGAEKQIAERIFYVSTEAEFESALTSCGDGIGVAGQNGCIIQLEGGAIDISDGVEIAGATAATGRTGLVIRGTGGYGPGNSSGFNNGGTVLNWTGAGAGSVLTVGDCFGCELSNFSINGNDLATAGIEVLSTSGAPAKLNVHDMGIWDINGTAILGNTGTGQFDESNFANMNITNSSKCFHSRHSQSVGIVLGPNFICTNMNGTGPYVDIEYGAVKFIDSYIGTTVASSTMLHFGSTANGLDVIRSVFEFDSATTVTAIDANDGATNSNVKRIRIDGNRFTFTTAGHTGIDIDARGNITVVNNFLHQPSGSNDIVAPTFSITNEESFAGNRTHALVQNNIAFVQRASPTDVPELWQPTVGADVWLDPGTVVADSDDSPTTCIDGQIKIVNTTGALTACVSDTWTDPPNLAGGVVGSDSITVDELDDEARTPTAGYAVVVHSDNITFDYLDLGALGGGDVTGVGPACDSGFCYTDGLPTLSQTMFVYEGTTADANQITINIENAEPTTASVITIPEETGTIVTDNAATLAGLTVGNATNAVNATNATTATEADGMSATGLAAIFTWTGTHNFTGATTSGLGEMFYVTNYGTGNNLAAINSAISACVAAEGGIVMLPRGQIEIDASTETSPLINMPGVDNGAGTFVGVCTLQGYGSGGDLNNSGGAGVGGSELRITAFDDMTATGGERVAIQTAGAGQVLRDFSIDMSASVPGTGAGTNTLTEIGIDIVGGYRGLIENVKVTDRSNVDQGVGIRIADSLGITLDSVHSSKFERNLWVANGTLTSNGAYINGSSFRSGQVGVYIEGDAVSATNGCREITFSGGINEGNLITGIQFESDSLCHATIVGVHFENQVGSANIEANAAGAKVTMIGGKCGSATDCIERTVAQTDVNDVDLIIGSDWRNSGANVTAGTVIAQDPIGLGSETGLVVLRSNSIDSQNINLTDSYAWNGVHNFATSTLELPNSVTLPATCNVGETYVDSNAPVGQKHYICESTNTWIVQGDDYYYCDDYGTPGDIGAQCNAAYAAMISEANRGGTIVVPRGAHNQDTVVDFCDETGENNHVPVRLIGQGGAPGSPGSRFDASATLRPAAITGTNFSVSAGTGAGGRDQITCTGCDFAAYFNRGDRLETSGFTNAANNISRATQKLPLIVWRAETTTLTVEGELLDAGLVTDATLDTATVQKLVPQVEICSTDQNIMDIAFNGTASEFSDFGILMRPDNQVQDGCVGNNDPTDICNGVGTSEFGQVAIISLNNTISDITAQNQKYAGVFLSTTNSMGQSDNFVVEKSVLQNSPIGVWADSLQAHPAVVVRDNDISAYSLNGLRLSSGAMTALNNTIISNDADCDADSWGTCRAVSVGAGNVLGLTMISNDLELRAGDGVFVTNLNTNQRHLNLIANSTQHNDPDLGATVMPLVEALQFCGSIVNLGNEYKTNAASITGAPTVTFGNSNQASCVSSISGRSSYYATGAGSSDPVLVVNNSIPTAVYEDSSPVWTGTHDFSASAVSLILPTEATTCAETAEGSICWDADDDVLYVGNNGGQTPITGGAVSFSAITTGTSTQGPYTLDTGASLVFNTTTSGTAHMSGTATAGGNPALPANSITLSTDGILFEGDADAFEGNLRSLGALTGDRQWTLPDASGVILTTTSTIDADTLNVNALDDATDVATSLCAANQVLKKNAGNTAWECAADDTGSGSLGANLTSATNDITSSNEAIVLAGTTESLTVTFSTDTATITSATGVTSINFPDGSIPVTDLVGITTLSGANTGDEVAATDSLAGIVELATIAETNTGTDTGRAITPAALEGWTGSEQLTTSGVLTITGSIAPRIIFNDSDTLAEVNDANITAQCTDANGGTEDCDLAFSTQANSVLTEAFRIDTTTGGVQTVVFAADITAANISATGIAATADSTFGGTTNTPGTFYVDVVDASNVNVYADSFISRDNDGSNAITLDDNTTFAGIVPTGNQVSLFTRTDGNLYKKDAGDPADGLEILTESSALAAANVAGSLALGDGTITASTPTEFDTAANISTGLTEAELGGKWFYVITTAGTITLPEITASGHSFCVYNTVASALTLTPNATDVWSLGATTGAAGVGIVSNGEIGEYLCAMSREVGGADVWYALGRNGTWN